jgi:DNA-binding GntR family transcriptional regulator
VNCRAASREESDPIRSNGVERARRACREHDAIAKAFRDGRPEERRQALRTQIRNVTARIWEILDMEGGKL